MDEEIPEITIRRDLKVHRWVYVGTGAHLVKTPFTDAAPAAHVKSWLMANANGRLKVKVDVRL